MWCKGARGCYWDERNDPTEDTEEKKKFCSTSKIIIGIFLAALIAFVIVDSLTTRYLTDAVQDFLEWIEDNPVAGIFLFIIVYFIATVFFIPGSLLTLGAGFVFSSAFGLGLGVALGMLVIRVFVVCIIHKALRYA
jgi:uncharacterized membrane protein YdjX (TVP38/TMEM64 family)